MRLVAIMLSTNNPDNGCDTGRVTAINASAGKCGEIDIDLVADDSPWSRGGIACHVVPHNPYYPEKQGVLTLRHRKFEYLKHIDWYGNWCWRLVVVDIQTANEIFRYLYSMKKWNCEGGLTRLYELWEGKRDWHEDFHRKQMATTSFSEAHEQATEIERQ